MLVFAGLQCVSMSWWSALSAALCWVVTATVAAQHLQSAAGCEWRVRRVRPGPGSSWQWAAAARSQSQSWASCGPGPASPGLKSRGSGSEAPAWPWMSSGSTNLSAHFKGCNLWLKCHILGHTGGGDEMIIKRISPCLKIIIYTKNESRTSPLKNTW